MALLTADQRRQVARRFAEVEFRDNNQTANLDVDDLMAAAQEADIYQDSVTVAYNTALPLRFRNNATARQKNLLLRLVMEEHAP